MYFCFTLLFGNIKQAPTLQQAAEDKTNCFAATALPFGWGGGGALLKQSGLCYHEAEQRQDFPGLHGGSGQLFSRIQGHIQ